MRGLVITYTCVAVLTFGYAASNPRTMFPKHDISVSSLIAAGMWPLYWSWEAFDLGRSALEPADD